MINFPILFDNLFISILVKIQRHEVTVYPDDTHKPSVGEELNIPARITLLGVYPTDRTTREEIMDSERIKAAHYNDYLREVTKKFDGEFINYDIIDGSWTFMVRNKNIEFSFDIYLFFFVDFRLNILHGMDSVMSKMALLFSRE